MASLAFRLPRYRSSRMEERDEVGLSNGLAVTMFGGELLATEVSVVPGKGKLVLTGKLGEVMQESAQAAMSYVRSRADALGLERDFYQKVDVHVHFPEGAVPKDGPSAGITMVTSLVSALLRLPVRRDVAMTGVVTLRGRWLPIVTRRDVLTVLSDVGTLGDAAALLGVRPTRVANWAARHEDFPSPVGRVGRWSVYMLSAIEAWAESSDRIA